MQKRPFLLAFAKILISPPSVVEKNRKRSNNGGTRMVCTVPTVLASHNTYFASVFSRTSVNQKHFISSNLKSATLHDNVHRLPPCCLKNVHPALSASRGSYIQTHYSSHTCTVPLARFTLSCLGLFGRLARSPPVMRGASWQSEQLAKPAHMKKFGSLRTLPPMS